MSAPPLPDIFGNYALGDFAEVVSPANIDWMPQTAGWWWLAVGLLFVLTRYCFIRARLWYRNRYRREAASQLEQLALGNKDEGLLIDLNRLLKLTALAAFSREQVARLSGTQWITFLNQQCPTPPFSEELGELLAVGTYQFIPMDDTTRQQLLEACRNWVNTHASERNV
jgi:hypothetical protein